jgi:hypothetical protein
MTEMNGISGEIRAFAEAHTQGWSHEEWLAFFHHVESEGHDVSDPDGIGLALEQERLRIVLKESGLKGLGPKRIESITRHFATLQNLRMADARNIAEHTGIPKALAEELSAHF